MLHGPVCSVPVELTRGVGVAPALSQTQRVASPGGGGLVVGEAWRRAAGGRAAAGPLGDLPQLVRQGPLALGDGPLGPGGLHFREFTFTVGTRRRVTAAFRDDRVMTFTVLSLIMILRYQRKCVIKYHNSSWHDCSFTPQN